MDIAKDAQKGDILLEEQGLKLYLGEEANNMLMNTKLDFQEERGFTLTGMPPASCSC